jgi:hypothetical protein
MELAGVEFWVIDVLCTFRADEQASGQKTQAERAAEQQIVDDHCDFLFGCGGRPGRSRGCLSCSRLPIARHAPAIMTMPNR